MHAWSPRTGWWATVGFLGAWIAIAPAAGSAGEETGPATIRVRGYARFAAAPDVLTVAFTVETTAPTAARASEENAARAGRVIGALKEVVAENGRVTTSGYRLFPVYDEPTAPRPGAARKPTLIGYRAENEIAVEITRLADAGRLIDIGVRAGVDRVNDMRFDLTDRAGAHRRALAAAGADARAQAEAIAGGLGVRLGRLRSASAAPEAVSVPYERFAVAARMASAEVPVEPGDVRVEASLDVTYAVDE
jgi:hypothetical protein